MRLLGTILLAAMTMGCAHERALAAGRLDCPDPVRIDSTAHAEPATNTLAPAQPIVSWPHVWTGCGRVALCGQDESCVRADWMTAAALPALMRRSEQQAFTALDLGIADCGAAPKAEATGAQSWLLRVCGEVARCYVVTGRAELKCVRGETPPLDVSPISGAPPADVAVAAPDLPPPSDALSEPPLPETATKPEVTPPPKPPAAVRESPQNRKHPLAMVGGGMFFVTWLPTAVAPLVVDVLFGWLFIAFGGMDGLAFIGTNALMAVPIAGPLVNGIFAATSTRSLTIFDGLFSSHSGRAVFYFTIAGVELAGAILGLIGVKLPGGAAPVRVVPGAPGSLAGLTLMLSI